MANLVEGHPEDGFCWNRAESRLPVCLAGNGCGSLPRPETPCRASAQERMAVGQREDCTRRCAALGCGAPYPGGVPGRLGRNAGLNTCSALWDIRVVVTRLALHRHKRTAPHAFTHPGYLPERFLGTAVEPGLPAA